MPRFHEWNVSGDITAAYTVTPDVHAHATYTRSYKSGGINLSGLPLNGANNPILPTATVEPEKVNHSELGLKTQSTDHRLTLDIAAFWTKIGNYQATVDNQQLNVIRGYLANADKVRTGGGSRSTPRSVRYAGSMSTRTVPIPTRNTSASAMRRARRSATSGRGFARATTSTSSAGSATRSTRTITRCWRRNRAAPGRSSANPATRAYGLTFSKQF